MCILVCDRNNNVHSSGEKNPFWSRNCGENSVLEKLKTTTLCLETRYMLGIDYHITEHQQISIKQSTT